jgi:hypothetical protein
MDAGAVNAASDDGAVIDTRVADPLLALSAVGKTKPDSPFRQDLMPSPKKESPRRRDSSIRWLGWSLKLMEAGYRIALCHRTDHLM